MSAKLLKLDVLEQMFLTTVNWMEIIENLKHNPEYLTNNTADCIYVIDIDLDHFGVTLLGNPERTAAFKTELGRTMENAFAEYAKKEAWRNIEFS